MLKDVVKRLAQADLTLNLRELSEALDNTTADSKNMILEACLKNSAERVSQLETIYELFGKQCFVYFVEQSNTYHMTRLQRDRLLNTKTRREFIELFIACIENNFTN